MLNLNKNLNNEKAHGKFYNGKTIFIHEIVKLKSTLFVSRILYCTHEMSIFSFLFLKNIFTRNRLYIANKLYVSFSTLRYFPLSPKLLIN